MALANDLRKGMAIRYNGNPAIVLEVQHRTPGNLRAFVQAIIRYIATGKSADVRFGSTDKVELVDVSRQQLSSGIRNIRVITSWVPKIKRRSRRTAVKTARTKRRRNSDAALLLNRQPAASNWKSGAVPTRWVKNLAGLFLLPICVITTIAFFKCFARATIQQEFWATEEFWFFT